MFVFWLLLGVALGITVTMLWKKERPTVMADAVVVRQELQRIETAMAGSLSRMHLRFDEVLAEVKKKV